MTAKIPLKFGTHLKKHTKQRERESGGSIFSAAGRNRYKDIEDGIRRLSKAFSFRDIHTNDEEPGLYCKYPRITMMKQQNDSLHSIPAQELIARINERHHSDTKQNTWIDIQGTHDEMSEIARVFGLHPLTLEDCITFDTREKISITSNYIFLVIHDVSLPGDKGVNLNMILFPDLLLTLHEKPVHSIYDVVPKLSYCDDTEIPSIEYLVYVILSSIISFYGAHVEQIRQGADLLDDKVMRYSTGRKDTKERKTSKQEKQETSDLLASLSAALKRASNLRQNISIKKDLLASLTRQEELFSKKGMQYIKSAYDQVLKMDLQVSLLHDMINDIHELCMAKISVQLAVAANEVGDNSRQFAVISAIFLPATLISGILGMNVKVPSGFDPDHHNIVPFVTIIIVMIIISVLQLFLYRKMKWL